MQSSPDAAFLLSREGTIIYRNRAASLLFFANVENRPLTSLFTFPDDGRDHEHGQHSHSHSQPQPQPESQPESRRELLWEDLVQDLSPSRPRHRDAIVREADGTTLAFRVGLVRLSDEMRHCERHSADGLEAFACAYATPLHDHQDEATASRGRGDYTIREERSGEEEDDDDDDDDDDDRVFASPTITERQRRILQGTDRDLANHMRDIVQSSLDPMLSLFENGTIWMANDRTAEVFGYAPEDLVGTNIADICPQAVVRRDDATADAGDAPVGTVRRTDSHDDETTLGRIKHATIRHRFTSQLLPVELGISRLPSSSFFFRHLGGDDEPVYFAHIKDLSQLHEHRDLLAHKDDLCQAMIDASFDPMFGIDQRGKILVCNRAACSMFGYTRDEFLESNISVICNDRDAPHHERHMARYIRTGEKRVIGRKRPLVARRKDGSQFHIELGVSEVDLKNGEKMFCGYVRDMTQQRLDKLNLRKKEAVIHEKFFSTKLGMPQDEAEKLGEGKRREILRGQRKVESLPGGMLGDE
ncbi:hypothetical protein ACHAXS_009215 [Conticribra weissflogii]